MAATRGIPISRWNAGVIVRIYCRLRQLGGCVDDLHPIDGPLGDVLLQPDHSDGEIGEILANLGKAQHPFLVADKNLGRRILEAELQFVGHPPGVDAHDHGTHGSDRPIGEHPLGKVAHGDRHAITVTHTLALQPVGD